MEVNIAGRPYCHLADYLFNEEQAFRMAPWTPLYGYPRQNPFWPYWRGMTKGRPLTAFF